jgi:hypothetical protein
MKRSDLWGVLLIASGVWGGVTAWHTPSAVTIAYSLAATDARP